jgi:ATP-binding cassette subfamily C protein
VRGKVRLDGAALDQWSSDMLGRHIGYLPQDVELFGGTIAQNISRFDPDATSEGIIAAAKEAGVHEMIKMREGYNTQVGEQGAAIVIVVAHRPIGVEAVDQILVLRDGRMQAFGPKEQVLSQVLQPRVAPPAPIKIVSEGGVTKS